MAAHQPFLRHYVDEDLPRRDRLDVRSYRALMAHNVEALIGLAETSTPKVQHSARKYTSAVPVLRDLLDHPDTPLTSSVKDQIHRQLDLAEQRFTAILAA